MLRPHAHTCCLPISPPAKDNIPFEAGRWGETRDSPEFGPESWHATRSFSQFPSERPCVHGRMTNPLSCQEGR